MKTSKRLLNGLLIFLAVIMSCGVCFADLLSAIPKDTGQVPSVRVAVRLTDAGKFIGDLYPSNLLDAIGLISPAFGLNELVAAGDIMKALSKSNLREAAAVFIYDKDGRNYDGGLILSVPGGVKILDGAVSSGKLTTYDLMRSFGEPVLEAMKAAGVSLVDHEFKLGGDGVFFGGNDYVCIEGDKIIMFETKEGALSAARAIKKADVPMETAKLKSPNVFLIHVSKEISKTTDDINVEIGVSYDDSAWKIKALNNVFRMTPGGDSISVKAEELEAAVKVLETVPFIGNGTPFFTFGGKTFLDGFEAIEKYLMDAGDMDLTLNWATFLQMAQQCGISKEVLGNLLSGSIVMVLGLDSKLFEISLPFGGYFAATGREGAAEKAIAAISEILAQAGLATESKVDGWDNVYSVNVLAHNIPSSVIARRGETLLAGFMSPDDLRTALDTKELGLTFDKTLSWIALSTEKIWACARSVYGPLSAMLMSGMFGDIPDGEKEIIQFTEQLLQTDIPIKALKLWIPAPGELDMEIIMNPSPHGDFWGILFEWALKIMNNI
ncbi:MAG: hypothetical protein FWG09_07255 [Synergistaceae bacterium]|nr:hypothetical protein [Synergistaceae bacterium]